MSKYGVITSDKKTFHPHEPIFLIRATDPLAVAAINQYQALAIKHNCTMRFAAEVSSHALRIANWQRQNPELVKQGVPD